MSVGRDAMRAPFVALSQSFAQRVTPKNVHLISKKQLTIATCVRKSPEILVAQIDAVWSQTKSLIARVIWHSLSAITTKR